MVDVWKAGGEGLKVVMTSTWTRQKCVTRVAKLIRSTAVCLHNDELCKQTCPLKQKIQTNLPRRITVALNRKRLVCPRDGSRFVPGTGPGLSQGRRCS